MVRIKKEWIKLEFLKFHACVWPFRCYGCSYGCFLPFSSIFSFRYFALTNSPLCPVLCYFCLKKNEKLLYFCVFYKRKRSVVLTGRINCTFDVELVWKSLAFDSFFIRILFKYVLLLPLWIYYADKTRIKFDIILICPKLSWYALCGHPYDKLQDLSWFSSRQLLKRKSSLVIFQITSFLVAITV